LPFDVSLDLLAVIAHDALCAADGLPSRAQLLRHVMKFVFLVADAAAIPLAALSWIVRHDGSPAIPAKMNAAAAFQFPDRIAWNSSCILSRHDPAAGAVAGAEIDASSARTMRMAALLLRPPGLGQLHTEGRA